MKQDSELYADDPEAGKYPKRLDDPDSSYNQSPEDR